MLISPVETLMLRVDQMNYNVIFGGKQTIKEDFEFNFVICLNFIRTYSIP
jgi:hypothetical protein